MDKVVTIVVLKVLEARMLRVANECDIFCDHSVGICCGWHYEGYGGGGITKTGFKRYLVDLKKTMVETDRLNPDCTFEPKYYRELDSIMRTLKGA